MIDGRTDGASSSPFPFSSVVGGIGCCVTKRIALLRIFSTVIIGSTQRTTVKNCKVRTLVLLEGCLTEFGSFYLTHSFSMNTIFPWYKIF